MMRTVTVLGTGAMGAAIARRLAARGLEVRAWNRSRERPDVAALEVAGVTLVEDPRLAVAPAEAVVTLLPTAAAVEDVVVEGGVLEALRPGSAWVQMGTIGVEAVERLDDLVRARRPEVCFVDAPVSGSREPAERGALLVLAAGPEEMARRLAPLFDAIGWRTLWVGAAGSATRLKLVLNTWLAFEVEAAVESMALARRLEVPPEILEAALWRSPLASSFALSKLAKVRSGKLEPDFALVWALKDLDLAAAAAAGVVPPVARAIAARWRSLVASGRGNLDVSAAWLGLDAEGVPPVGRAAFADAGRDEVGGSTRGEVSLEAQGVRDRLQADDRPA